MQSQPPYFLRSSGSLPLVARELAAGLRSLARPGHALLLLVLVALSGCPQPAATCDVKSCTGCCDSAGSCQSGMSTLICGVGGAMCVSCPFGMSCFGGTCLTSSGGGAGGGSGGGSGGGTGGGGGTDAGVTCAPCLVSSECGPNGACVQYAGSDYCALTCAGPCPTNQTCLATVREDGTQVSVCVPSNGSCGSGGCGTCPPGSTCDLVAGSCETLPDAGPTPDAGRCGVLDGPPLSSCCRSCSPDAGTCQPNGCYGGWWCDSSLCRCQAPPTSCGSDAGTDGGTDGGRPDAGPNELLGPDGGALSHLFFAVVGDTRPALVNDTAHYPTAVITRIYQVISQMNPRPQFVVTTGDYMFASSGSTEGQTQMGLYLGAQSQYPGTVFSALGNHECTGATASNCDLTTPTNNYRVFLNSMVVPLGRSDPYYSVPIRDTAGRWTAKLVVIACNAWDATQQAWLTTELARATTYTFVVRHEPPGAGAPCNTVVDPMMQTATYNLLIQGHTHTYSHSGRAMVEGVGGAPISGSASYGFATVEQLAAGGFKITQYDYQTAQPLSAFTVP